ncbi:transmembrane protein Tmp21 precursor [Pelomyxa schiedti]|nr:transmembrane protein Tmp21 precursor [Pelomyxa schiedti]
MRQATARRMRGAVVAAIMLVVVFAAIGGEGLVFDIPFGRPRCIGEEVRKNIPVTGTFETVAGNQEDTRELILRIADGSGHEVLRQSEMTGSGVFDYVPTESGELQFCFQDSYRGGGRGQVPRTVKVVINTGSSVLDVDFSELAKKENLKPIEIKLRRIENECEVIESETAYLKEREKELRNLNESTNSRAAWLSIFSLVVLVLSTVWQIVYLKYYFSKKKLI